MSNMKQMLKDTQNHSIHNKTLSENGAIMYKSTGSTLADLEMSVTNLRNKSQQEIENMFEKAYLEDPVKAVKWAFLTGDVREGKGERRTFDILLNWIAKNHPDVATELLTATMKTPTQREPIHLLPEYTRWDHVSDLLITLSNDRNNPAYQAALDIVVKQFKQDIAVANYLAIQEDGKPVNKQLQNIVAAETNELNERCRKNPEYKPAPSLLAKWLPSIQTKKPEDRKVIKALENALGINHAQYRQALSAIRPSLNILERNMSLKAMEEVNQEHMTAAQQLKYREKLAKDLGEAREEYLEKVEAGEAKINTGNLNPDDIVYQYTQGQRSGWGGMHLNYDATLEELWKNQKDVLKDAPAQIVIRDGSGSMTCPINQGESKKACMDVGDALTIYMAERLTGDLRNCFITFSSRPEFVELPDNSSLCDKLNFLSHYDDCSNTNIEATFDLLLDTLVQHNVPQEEIPQGIVIMSDMEFDHATDFRAGRPDATLFDHIQAKWDEAGYQMPHLTFWNLNAERALVPVIDNERGISMVSGYSVNNLQVVLAGASPEQVVEMLLAQPRYDAVQAACERGLEKEKELRTKRNIEMAARPATHKEHAHKHHSRDEEIR